jgi:hypothetical protein
MKYGKASISRGASIIRTPATAAVIAANFRGTVRIKSVRAIAKTAIAVKTDIGRIRYHLTLKQSHFRRILGARMMKPGNLKEVTNLHQSIRLLVVAAACVLCAFYQGASAADNHPALTPNQDFSNTLLQVHAPASEGWFGSERSTDHIAFGKRLPRRSINKSLKCELDSGRPSVAC